jgi:hypothetical protein
MMGYWQRRPEMSVRLGYQGLAPSDDPDRADDRDRHYWKHQTMKRLVKHNRPWVDR